VGLASSSNTPLHPSREGNRSFPTLILLIAVFSLAACKKNNDAPTTGLSTTLNIINASTDTVNFYLNGTRLNSNSNLYPLYSSGYITVLAGSQNFQIKRAFNTTTSNVQSLFTIPLKLDTAKYYSLFIAGETADHAFSTVDTLKADTSTSSCLLRFVNASPDAVSYDLTVGSSLKFSNRAFKSATGFTTVDTATYMPVALYQAGSATALIKDTVTLVAGKSYTIYTIGKQNGTGGSKLGLTLMVNYN
jgi:hypothetical protein